MATENGESIRKCVKGNNLLFRSVQRIKFVAILELDVCIISAAIFVLLGGALIWRPHSEPYKFLLYILKNNSAAENCTDVMTWPGC